MAFVLVLEVGAEPKEELVRRVLTLQGQAGDSTQKFERIRPYLTPELAEPWAKALTRQPKDGFWLDFEPLERNLFGKEPPQFFLKSQGSWVTVRAKTRADHRDSLLYRIKLEKLGTWKIGNILYPDGVDFKNYLQSNLELSKRESIFVK